MRVCPLCSTQTDALLCPKDGTATIRPRSTVNVSLPVEGDVIAGRYRVQGVLGRGGFGAVYRVLHTGTGQDCALKVLALGAHDDSSVIRRFFAEARVTAGLKHVNTVRVFDFGQDDNGWYFLAMELLEGACLADVLRNKAQRGDTMTEVAAAQIGISVLRSLVEAHAAGLVHRDLKPHNIFLHEVHGEEPVVKVLDFGIAKSSEFSLTLANQALGTPTYMSPEQCQSAPVDGRSDLYSLGCILYQMVVGVPPFRADNLAALVMKQMSEQAPDVRHAARKTISDAFAAVVAKALRKSADERFSSAAEMRDALRACVGETVPLPRPLSDAPAGRKPEDKTPSRPETVAYVAEAEVNDTTGFQSPLLARAPGDVTRAEPKSPRPGLGPSQAPEPGSWPTSLSGKPALMPEPPTSVPETEPMTAQPDVQPKRPWLWPAGGAIVVAVLAFAFVQSPRGPAQPVVQAASAPASVATEAAAASNAGSAAVAPASPAVAIAGAREVTQTAQPPPAPLAAPMAAAAPAPAAAPVPAASVVPAARPEKAAHHPARRPPGRATVPSPHASTPKEDRL